MLSAEKYEQWFRKNHPEFLGPDAFLLIGNDKYESSHYLCHTIDDLLKSAVKVVYNRLDLCVYAGLSRTDLSIVNKILDTRNGWLALSFLSSRSHYEYEFVEWKLFDTL